MLANALDQATSKFLKNRKSPSRVVNELDTRGSHFYLALYWAQALAEQKESEQLQDAFRDLAARFTESESTIIEELTIAQGEPVEIGGYYHPDEEQVLRAMRPSATFNAVLATLDSGV